MSMEESIAYVNVKRHPKVKPKIRRKIKQDRRREATGQISNYGNVAPTNPENSEFYQIVDVHQANHSKPVQDAEYTDLNASKKDTGNEIDIEVLPQKKRFNYTDVMVHPKNSDGDTTKENNPEDETMMNIEFSQESEYQIDNLEGSVMKDKRRLSAYLFAFYLVLIMFAIGVAIAALSMAVVTFTKLSPGCKYSNCWINTNVTDPLRNKSCRIELDGVSKVFHLLLLYNSQNSIACTSSNDGHNIMGTPS